MWQVTVDIQKLQHSLIAICTELAEQYPDGLPLENDYYWSVPDDEVLDIEKPPSKLTLGSVVDDLEDISAFVRNTGDLAHALMHASGLLRVLAREATRGPSLTGESSPRCP